MAASPEVMQANGAPPPPPGAEGAPAAAPMMTPQHNAGEQEGAKPRVLMAQKLLENVLSKFPGGGKEHKAILKAITALAGGFGKDEDKTEELLPAEIKEVNQGLVGPGAVPKPPAPPQGAAPPGAAPQPGAR